MYHPPPVSAAEQAAGFSDPDDFEFLRLTNIGTATVSLENLRFTDGVTFDFSTATLPALAPGASVLVVGNRDAFRLRYGSGHDTAIAGEFLGNLKNGGETLALGLADPAGSVLHAIGYEDRNGWPPAADGFGSSLLLDGPAADPAQATAWTASAHPGGHPGGSPRPMSYDAWKHLSFPADQALDPAISGPLADPDRDKLVNFMEYALGASALLSDADGVQARPFLTTNAGQTHLGIEYVAVPTALDAIVAPEHSSDLQNWFGGGTSDIAPPGPRPSGHVRHFIRLIDPIDPSSAPGFIRLQATGLP